MNPAIVLKLLDLAFLGLSAWERYDESRREIAVSSDRIADIRRRLLAGDLSEEQASAEIDGLIDGVISKRKAAMARLPVYQVREFDVE